MTMPKTSRSSGYQSPPAASVTAGSLIAGMHPRTQGQSTWWGWRSSMKTPPQLSKRQSMSASASSKKGIQSGSTNSKKMRFQET